MNTIHFGGRGEVWVLSFPVGNLLVMFNPINYMKFTIGRWKAPIIPSWKNIGYVRSIQLHEVHHWKVERSNMWTKVVLHSRFLNKNPGLSIYM